MHNLQKHPAPSPLTILWYFALGIVGMGIVLFTAINFLPVLGFGQPPESNQTKIPVPVYDYVSWHALPVQHRGRYKPFETAAVEVLRDITGRSRFQGHDAVAVILMWMLDNDPQEFRPVGKWDEVPFILCEHQDLRRLVYLVQEDGSLKDEQPTHDQIHGKYMSPAELRPFRKRFLRIKEENKERFIVLFDTLRDQAGEVLHRLETYESIRNIQTPPEEKGEDPFSFVALDRVTGSPWFSLSQIRQIVKDPKRWQGIMKERVKDAPQLYISPEHHQALEEFQEKIQAGQGTDEVASLGAILKERRTKLVQEFLDLRKKGEKDRANELLIRSVQSFPREDLPNLIDLLDNEKEKKQDLAPEIAAEFGNLLGKRDARVLDDLRERLPTLNQRYDPADPRFRMLHLSFLETRYPDLYETATRWQEPPLKNCQAVLARFDDLGKAYRAGDNDKFTDASQAFFVILREISEKYGPYPGQDTISDRLSELLSGSSLNPPSSQLLGLELTFNHVKPFMWAWVLMLLALLMYCLSLGLDSRKFYLAGWLVYVTSLVLQGFGFFTRIIISGRPPVSNMYETVIWVSFMSAIFALVLEAIYRRKVIALAGAMVATLGLVLADQLPLALDPRISPLVPVLRSNFWLTIHVLTIVSSYAGGTLAWGLGNIALVLITFGHGSKETVKMLSQFTYRALQVAVLLLAAGTFLGGWWAAYSWGRFWGWDPKETGALIALLCYVIPLHMRYIGWIKDFGLAVAAILCYAAILISWYGVNFIFPAGLHAYGFGAGGASWVYWACLINIEWVLVAGRIFHNRVAQTASYIPPDLSEQGEIPSPGKSEYVKA